MSSSGSKNLGPVLLLPEPDSVEKDQETSRETDQSTVSRLADLKKTVPTIPDPIACYGKLKLIGKILTPTTISRTEYNRRRPRETLEILSLIKPEKPTKQKRQKEC